MTTILEKMEQAAREGVAAKLVADGHPLLAGRARSGRHDDELPSCVAALLGVRAAYAWLEAEGLLPGWRPIDENTPRDGDRADLWVVPHDAFASGPAGRVADAWFRAGEWWRMIDHLSYRVAVVGVPTHLMPVPSPPAMLAAAEAADVQDA